MTTHRVTLTVTCPRIVRCSHQRFVTMRRVESWPDDHTTEYGQCSDCDQYLVHTVFPTRDEWAVMTPSGQQREVDAYDPTLYCTGCHAKRFRDCECGPTVENN